MTIEAEKAFDALVLAMEGVIEDQLRDGGCPCRFPRFRALVSLDTSKAVGGSFTVRERTFLVVAYEKKVPIVDKGAVPPWTEIIAQMWRGKCGVCGSIVTRSSNESGTVDYLVFDRPRDLREVGASLEDGKILRTSAFSPGEPHAQGAGKAAAIYPLVPLDELVRWLQSRAVR